MILTNYWNRKAAVSALWPRLDCNATACCCSDWPLHALPPAPPTPEWCEPAASVSRSTDAVLTSWFSKTRWSLSILQEMSTNVVVFVCFLNNPRLKLHKKTPQKHGIAGKKEKRRKKNISDLSLFWFSCRRGQPSSFLKPPATSVSQLHSQPSRRNAALLVWSAPVWYYP